MRMYKVYIFIGILFYLIYYIISSTYINSPTTSIKKIKNTNDSFIKSNTLIKKNEDFVDKMIHKYAYFLNKNKKIVKNNIHSNNFFDIIDEIFLKKLFKNENIYFFL